MDKIKWCLGKKSGIELIEPNQNLADGYIKKAEESLETSKLAKSKDWKISGSYYAIYFSIYSVMMQIGIKCEIHSCTIEFTKRFLKDYISAEDLKLFETGFDARNDSQYYVDREVAPDDYEKLIKEAPAFLAKCKNVHLTEDIVNEIRGKLKKYIKKRFTKSRFKNN